MPFELWTRVGPVRHALDGGPDPLKRRGSSGDHASDTIEQWMRPVCAPAGHKTLHAAGGSDAALC